MASIQTHNSLARVQAGLDPFFLGVVRVVGTKNDCRGCFVCGGEREHKGMLAEADHKYFRTPTSLDSLYPTDSYASISISCLGYTVRSILNTGSTIFPQTTSSSVS